MREVRNTNTLFTIIPCSEKIDRHRDRETERQRDRETERQTEMGWLRLVGSLKVYVSLSKEPYKRDGILHKRPIVLRSLLVVATP